MAEVDTVQVLDKDSVSREVATTSKLIKTVGLPGDDKSSATDTTSVTHTSLLKQISASVQALRSANSLDDIVATLAEIAGYVDGLETLIGSTNTKLDQVHTDLATTLAAYVDGLESGFSTLNGKDFATQTTLAALLAALSSTASDGSGTITSGGTAQDLFSGGTPTNGFSICNPDPTEDLWISLFGTAAANAQGSIRIPANGGLYESPSGMKPAHAVSIVGATTGHKFTAMKW